MTSLPTRQHCFFTQCLLLTLLVFWGSAAFGQKTTIYKSIINRDTLKGGFKPKAGSDPNYRIYIGLAYNIVKFRGDKEPYAASHTIGLNYSFSENSFHPYYESFYPQVLGPWGIDFKVGYDQIRRANYFGMGNETPRGPFPIRYHWLRSHHQYASLGIVRPFGTEHRVTLSALYDGIQVLNDENRFIGKSRGTIDSAEFNWQYFLGPQLAYAYSHLNDPVLPTKGLVVRAAVAYQENLKRSGHSFARYLTDAELYVPVSSEFSYSLKTGVATLTGNPDFYQYNVIGGGTLRGYHRWRFYGKTAFYGQNELRWMRAVDAGGLTGHVGLFGLYDVGRVWMPDESSNKLHFGYGAGIIVSPLDKVRMSLAYAISNEDKRFHFTMGRFF